MDTRGDIASQVSARWISGKSAYDRAKLSWELLIERRHEKLRTPLLVLGDVAGWSVLLLGAIGLLFAGFLLMTVVVFPLFYLIFQLGGRYLLDRSTAIYGLGVLAMSNVAVYGLWCLPDCDVLVKRCGVNTEHSPEIAIQRSQILFFLALWLGGSVFAAVICLDVLVLGIAAYYAAHKMFSSLRFLLIAITTHRYLLLPAFVFFPLLIISWRRRRHSLRKDEIWTSKDIRVKKKWEKRAMQLERSFESCEFVPGRLPV